MFILYCVWCVEWRWGVLLACTVQCAWPGLRSA
nr:MAG TPA: hypothetical protein [Caudoviricetes sp.]